MLLSQFNELVLLKSTTNVHIFLYLCIVMTIIQLEYLIAVAKYGSFSAAATHCNVTQPSLSTQIKNLEEQLGVTLFIRNTKSIKLTEIGRGVVSQSKVAIAQFYGIEEYIKQMRGEIRGTLSVAAIPTIAPYLLHRFIPTFVADYPNVELVVKEMVTSDIISALESGTLDIGIAAAGFFEGEDIVEIPMFDDEFYLYASKDNEILQQEQISIIELDVNKLLLLKDGHCLRTQILDLCNKSNPLSSNLQLEGGSLETIMRVVDVTGGMTILPRMVIDFLSQERRDSCVRQFKEKNSTKRNIALVTSRNFIKTGSLLALKEAIVNCTK